MCFKGEWTKDHHAKDLLLTFVLLSSYSTFGAPFSDGIFFFFFVFVFLACVFLVFAHSHSQQGEFSTFLLSTRT